MAEDLQGNMNQLGHLEKGWQLQHAILCAVSWVFIGPLILAMGFEILSSFEPVARWLESPAGMFGLGLTSGILAIMLVVAFSREKSLDALLEKLGFYTPPSRLGYWGVVWGITLALIVGYFVRQGQIGESSATAAFRAVRAKSFLYLDILGLLMPFSEEIILRGYLYKAFRSTCKPLISTIGILFIVALTHRRPMLTSVSSFLLMSVMTCVLCYLRERTGSLWACILCHLSHNVTLVLLSVV